MGWGSSAQRGGGQKVLESLSSSGFERRNLDVPGVLPGCPGLLGLFRKSVQKSLCSLFGPSVERNQAIG